MGRSSTFARASASPPQEPVDGVVRVLQQVRAGFPGRRLGMLGWYVGITPADPSPEWCRFAPVRLVMIRKRPDNAAWVWCARL